MTIWFISICDHDWSWPSKLKAGQSNNKIQKSCKIEPFPSVSYKIKKNLLAHLKRDQWDYTVMPIRESNNDGLPVAEVVHYYFCWAINKIVSFLKKPQNSLNAELTQNWLSLHQKLESDKLTRQLMKAVIIPKVKISIFQSKCKISLLRACFN